MKGIIGTIKRKIFLLIGRGILTAINNSEGTQKVQGTFLKNETITDIERFQEYGFNSYPKTDAELLAGFLNGNRDHGIVLCANDRRYRPIDLSSGDVQIYNWKDNKITITDTGIVIEDTVNGNKIEMTSGGEINITGTKITLLGGTEAFLKGTTFDSWITATLLTIFNAHTHPGVTAGPATTGITATPLTAPSGHLSTDIKGK